MGFGTIFGLVILIVIVLAIVMVNTSKKNKKKQLEKTLFDFAEKGNCKISQHDLFNNTLIGIDNEAHKLFFIRKTADSEIRSEVDLTAVQKARVINSSRIVTNNETSHNVIDKLELSLSSLDSKIESTILEFYNTNRDNLFLNGELPLTEKWAKIVNTNIAGIAQLK
jgi:hypothetical protein